MLVSIEIRYAKLCVDIQIGEDASSKLERVREWIRRQPPDVKQYSRGQDPKQNEYARATLITHLPSIGMYFLHIFLLRSYIFLFSTAYLLNLRGSDIPYNPLFHAFLYVGMQTAILFLESFKCNESVQQYLNDLGVERRDYTEIWNFLRKRDWDFSEGKIIITPETSYTISLVISHMRCMVLPSFVEEMIGRKNPTELEGLRRAYLRDGVAFVSTPSASPKGASHSFSFTRLNSWHGWTLSSQTAMTSLSGRLLTVWTSSARSRRITWVKPTNLSLQPVQTPRCLITLPRSELQVW